MKPIASQRSPMQAESEEFATTLGALVKEGKGFVQTGPFGSQLHARDYIDEGIPVVMPQQLGDNAVDPDGIAQITERDRDRLRRHIMQEGDIVFSRRGDVTRRAYITKREAGWLCGTGCLLLRLKHPRCNNRYLSRFLSLRASKSYLIQRAVGGTMPNLNQAILESVPVQLPSLAEQDRIVSILSAYDDLIENNRQRIQLLEEAARLVHREWFVRLRFPDHHGVEIRGGVPDGWERKSINELCESIDYGYTASAEQDEVGPKFLRITDIVGGFIDWATVPRCKIEDRKLHGFLLGEGDIVVARTGATVGYAKRLHRRHPQAVFASYLVRLRLKRRVDSLLVGTFIESGDYRNYVRAHVGGAAQPNANAQVLASAKILVPPLPLRQAFYDVVWPIAEQREVLQIMSQRLRASRDLLLPRLMRGEIAV